MNTIDAATLAAAVRQHGLDCTTSRAAMFLGYWLELELVEQKADGYALTARGRELGDGLLIVDDLEEVAA